MFAGVGLLIKLHVINLKKTAKKTHTHYTSTVRNSVGGTVPGSKTMDSGMVSSTRFDGPQNIKDPASAKQPCSTTRTL